MHSTRTQIDIWLSILQPICRYSKYEATTSGSTHPSKLSGSMTSLTRLKKPYIMATKQSTTSACPTHSGRDLFVLSMSLLAVEDASGSGYALYAVP
jgi:hypothetical protein